MSVRLLIVSPCGSAALIGTLIWESVGVGQIALCLQDTSHSLWVRLDEARCW
jgi:hypothetical protein